MVCLWLLTNAQIAQSLINMIHQPDQESWWLAEPPQTNSNSYVLSQWKMISMWLMFLVSSLMIKSTCNFIVIKEKPQLRSILKCKKKRIQHIKWTMMVTWALPQSKTLTEDPEVKPIISCFNCRNLVRLIIWYLDCI